MKLRALRSRSQSKLGFPNTTSLRHHRDREDELGKVCPPRTDRIIIQRSSVAWRGWVSQRKWK